MRAGSSASKPGACRRCGTPLAGDGLAGNCPRCLATTLLAPDAPERVDSPPGPTLGRLGDYDLIEEIARGGMGVVFRARQSRLDREVAVKVIRDARLATPEQIRRFQAEAASAARLNHPNIVAVHAVGEQGGQHFFAMDLVRGQNLAEATRGGPLSPRQAAEVVEKVARAIQHAHEAGVLHRDLKPSNILMDARGEPRVTDFGLARLMEEDSPLTLTGQILGTPGYMAPEQARGGAAAGPAADVYGLGAVLFHLLTGHAPFVGASAAETLTRVLREDPVSPALLNPAVPADLAAVCMKCLAKFPDQRYGSAGELAEDLGRFREGHPTRARPAGALEGIVRWCRRKPALAGTLAAASLVVILLAVGAPIVAYRINRARIAVRQALYAADMRVTQQAIEEGDLGRARELLDGHVPRGSEEDPRGFEWHYFDQRARGDQLATIRAGTPGERQLALSSDGRLLAVGRLVYDAVSGDRRMDLPLGETDRALAFVPGTHRLLVAGPDGLGCRDLDTGDRVLFAPGRWGVPAVAFSASGRWLALGTRHELTLYDVRTWSRIGGNTNLGFTPWYASKGLAFSPDESRLVTAAGNPRPDASRLECWAVPSLDPLPFPTNGVGNVACICFPPDGREFYTGGWDGTVRVWNTRTGLEIPDRRSTHHHRSWIGDVAFLPGTHQLVSSGSDRCLRLWSTEPSERPLVLRGHASEISALAVAPSGTIFSLDDDGVIHRWSADLARQGETLSRADRSVLPVGLSRDGKLAVTLTEGRLQFWDLGQRGFAELSSRRWETEELKGVRVDPDRHDETVAISPDLKWLAHVRRNHSTELWNLSDRTRRTLPNTGDSWSFAVFSPDSEYLALPMAPDGLAIWDPATGHQWASISTEDPREATLSMAAGAGILAIGAETNALLWDLRERRPVRRFPILGGGCLALSPDGKLLATGDMDQRIRLYDCGAGKMVSMPLQGHLSGVESMAFSPDGRTLLSASRQSVIFWNVATRREVASYQQPARVLLTLFSTDGTALLTSDGAGRYLQIWRAPGVVRRNGSGPAERNLGSP